MSCVICECEDYDVLLDLDCGGFDDSTLYERVTVVCCTKCQHVYNLLTDKQITGLHEYYAGEYSLCNLTSPNKNGDIPGSSSQDSLNRYKELYDMIKSNVKSDTKILDVGCAAGGFLEYMTKYVDKECLYGIEPSESFAEVAKEKTGANISVGYAEHLNFDKKFFDVIVCDQVLEHLVDPNVFFYEVKKIIKKNGTLCISVPFAPSYNDCSFFDFYFFLMREHIQHFGFTQLQNLAAKHGFKYVKSYLTHPKLISNVGKLPNLTMVLKYDGECEEIFISNLVLKQSIIEYVNNSYKSLINRRNYIDSINCDELSLYGASRELHYLLRNTDLGKLSIIIFDDTTAKQEMTIDGRYVFNSDKIIMFKDENVMITSFAHIETMKNKLIEKGYKGKFL